MLHSPRSCHTSLSACLPPSLRLAFSPYPPCTVASYSVCILPVSVGYSRQFFASLRERISIHSSSSSSKQAQYSDVMLSVIRANAVDRSRAAGAVYDIDNKQYLISVFPHTLTRGTRNDVICCLPCSQMLDLRRCNENIPLTIFQHRDVGLIFALSHLM